MTTGNPNNDTWTPRLVVIGDSVFGDIVPINLVPGSEVKVLEKDILCGDTRINIISKVMVRSSYEAFMSGPSCVHQDMCVFWHTCLYTQLLILSYVYVNTFIHVM